MFNVKKSMETNPAATRPTRLLRVLRALWILVIALLAFRVVLPSLCMALARHLLAERGLTCRYESLDLGLLRGQVDLWHLRVSPLGAEEAAAAEDLLRVEHAAIDVSITDLLAGRISLRRVGFEGVDLRLDLSEAGIAALRGYAALDSGPAPDSSLANDVGEPGPREPAELSLPFDLTTLRLQHARVDLRDDTSTPPLNAHLEANLLVSNLGARDEPARAEFTLTSPSLLDVLRVSAEANTQTQQLEARMRVELANFRPVALTRQLERLRIVPTAGQISFEANVDLQARVQAADPGAVEWSAELHGVSGTEDLREFFGLDRLSLSLLTTGASVVDIQRIDLEGLRARASRSAEGALGCAGFELVAQAAPAAGFVAGAANQPARPAPAIPDFWIAKLDARGVSLRFDDAAVDPPASLALELETATLEQFGNDALRVLEPARFRAAMRLPGIAEFLRVDGSASAFAPERSASLSVALAGIEATALEGYLRPLGWTADLHAGVLKLNLEVAASEAADGLLRGRAEVSKVSYADRGGPQQSERSFFSLESLALEAFEFDPAHAALHLRELRVAGLDASAARDSAGQLQLFGLKRLPAPISAPVRPQPTLPAARGGALQLELPRIELERLIGQDARLTFRDASMGEQIVLSGHALRFGLTDLAVGGDASFDPATARLYAEGDLGSIAGLLDLSGTLRTTAAPLSVDLQLALRGERLDLRSLAPYTNALGLTPTMERGEFSMELGLAASNVGAAWVVDSTLRNVQLLEDQAVLASLESLAVRGLSIEPGRFALESLAIDRPTLALSRDGAGLLNVAGLRFEPRPEESAAVPMPPAAPTIPSDEPAPNLSFGVLRVQAARLDWKDASLVPTLETSLVADLELGPGNFGRAGPPLAFRASLGSPGNFERLGCAGQLTLPPSEMSIDMRLDARGLKSGQLARYLPENVAVQLRAGEAAAQFSAAIATADGGGSRVRCSLSEVVLRDEGDAQPKLELASLELAAQRIDPGAGVFLIDEISLAGLGLEMQRTSAGAVEVLGLSLSPAKAPASFDAASAPAVSKPKAPAQNGRASEPPVLKIAKLDLACERLSISSPDATGAPLVFNARLFSSAPLVILDRELEQIPALELAFECGLEPVLRELHADLRIEAFAREPRLDVQFKLRGIDAGALAKVAPELGALLDENSMHAGVLSARAGASLRLERSDLAEFDFSRDFGAEFSLEDLRLYESEGGEAIAGLDALRVDVQRFSPSSGALHIREIEIERPSATLTKRADGIHTLGLLIKLPRPAAESGAQASAGSAPMLPTIVLPPGPEIRIDSLLVREIDVLVRDESVEPVLVLPLDPLYAQVRHFSTRAFSEPLQVGLFATLGSKAGALPARGDEVLMAFDEMAMSGRLSFSPALKGWVKLDLSALDLRNFAGQAAAEGVELGDGYLDAGIRLRLPGDGTVSVSSGFTFSELSLSEPAGGPISSLLQLPAPLDVVLFAMKDADEEHSMPLNFQIEQGGVSTGALVGAALESVGVVVANAIASAPLRVASSVTDLFGITGGDEDPLANLAVTLEYAPGAIDLSAAQKASLARLIEALDDDEVVLVAQHAVGSGDIAYAQRLANPAPDECRELVARSRLRRLELQRLRDELAADARVLYAVGREDEARLAGERLRAAARELDSTEAALDGVLELLRPNSERRKAKRTRLSSLELAQKRLEALGAFIASSEVEHAAQRIELRKPTFAAPAAQSPPSPGKILILPRLRKSNG